MDATERFAAAVAAPAAEMRLDVAAFALAAHAHPDLDIDAACVGLDDLAARCPLPTFDGLRVYLFELLGFRGNERDYGDPENSFLDAVVHRRVGIPISLSVLMIEVGRRIGVPVHGVGMPGHFLVMDGARDGVWCDPFHGGALYDSEGCRRLFARVHGNARGFSRALLAPTDPHAIVTRILANLESGRLSNDPVALGWLCDLHLRLPDLPADQRDRIVTARRAVPRAMELAGEDDAAGAVLPMFPLGTVLFPYALLPLHVFEPRYRLMMRHVLDGDSEFGVVLIERGSEVGGGDTRFDVATLARVVQAAELPDGRFAVSTVGLRRVAVREWLTDDPYPRAVVTSLVDAPAGDGAVAARTRVVEEFAALAEIARRIDARVGEPPEFDADPVRASYEAAAVAPIGPLDAQRLLSTDDVATRLELLAGMLAERAVELRARLDLGD